MHNLALQRQLPVRRPKARRPHLSATHVVRAATAGDAADISQLVGGFAMEGLLLPRSVEEIEAAIEDYVVVVDTHERVRGCAALLSYSPSLAEVASVAVDRTAQGQGLGGLLVLGVEAIARRRGHREVFALTLAREFFASLGYVEADLASYPEKIARYEQLADRGVQVIPKDCVRKLLGAR